MAPEEIKERVQGAYRMAMENRSVQMLREPGVNRLFRDVRLYGREAGTDFAATNLERPVQEAVAMAECRQAALDLPWQGHGRAALEAVAVAQALRDLTALKVEVAGTSIRLVWARPGLGLV